MKKAAKRCASSGQVRLIVLDKLKQEAKRPTTPKSGRPSEQIDRVNERDVVARVGRGNSQFVITAPRGFETCPLVEIRVRGEIYNLLPGEAEAIGKALIAASQRAGAAE